MSAFQDWNNRHTHNANELWAIQNCLGTLFGFGSDLGREATAAWEKQRETEKHNEEFQTALQEGRANCIPRRECNCSVSPLLCPIHKYSGEGGPTIAAPQREAGCQKCANGDCYYPGYLDCRCNCHQTIHTPQTEKGEPLTQTEINERIKTYGESIGMLKAQVYHLETDEHEFRTELLKYLSDYLDHKCIEYLRQKFL